MSGFKVKFRNEYVARIHHFDGETAYTADPKCARIYEGAAWEDFWSSLDGAVLIPAEDAL